MCIICCDRNIKTMANSVDDCGHCYACIECMSQQLLTLNKCATCMADLREKRPFIVMYHPKSASTVVAAVAKGDTKSDENKKKRKAKTPSAQAVEEVIEIDSDQDLI